MKSAMINLRFEIYQIREFQTNDVEAIVKNANNRKSQNICGIHSPILIQKIMLFNGLIL